jgi:hypothetical protein
MLRGRSKVQRDGLVALAVHGGEDHHRRRRPGSEAAQHLKTVDAGQA